MSRRLIALVVLAPSLARAQDPLPSEAPATDAPARASDTSSFAIEPEDPSDTSIFATEPENPSDPSAPARDPIAPADLGDQAITATLGAAIGGRTTPGGLRVAGHYLYQLSRQDWFDGTAAFTFGGGSAECFRDRLDNVLCDHGLADGYAVELSANVRRFVGGNDKFWPFARAGMGIALVRFSEDDVTGVAIPLHVGVGLRVSVADAIAVVGLADLAFGIARFTGGVGLEPQLGINVSVGAEFRL
jgi:opacity protein-like surface antigen